MKKLIFAITIIVSVILFFIIWKSDDQYLGNNYYYLPKYEAIDIGYPGGGIVYESSEKYSFKKVIISGNVVEAIANEEFIIVSQNTDTSYVKKKHSNVTKQELLLSFIIDKKSDLLYGPFKKEEYLKKREEFGITKALKLSSG